MVLWAQLHKQLRTHLRFEGEAAIQRLRHGRPSAVYTCCPIPSSFNTTCVCVCVWFADCGAKREGASLGPRLFSVLEGPGFWGGGGGGERPWCGFVCLWRRLLASRPCTI